MQAYNAIIGNSTDLADLFSQGTFFHYTKPDLSGSSDVHAYPGITKKKELVFFLIPSEFDVEDTKDIASHIETCYIQKLPPHVGGNILPVDLAHEMCERWRIHYDTWIADQVALSPNGMFTAYSIPAEDFDSPTVRVTLALRLSASALDVMEADVVVTNHDGTAVYNYDYATTVPPLPATLAPSFYLLSLV